MPLTPLECEINIGSKQFVVTARTIRTIRPARRLRLAKFVGNTRRDNATERSSNGFRA